jgi:hypothetical protein
VNIVHSDLDVRVVLSQIAEREERLRRTNLRLPETDEVHRRPVRRWIGRQLVRLGTRLAAEPPMRPVRAP